MEYLLWTSEELSREERFYRRNLFNRLSGSRTAWLLGSRSVKGISNLGLFSQVLHIGASPPMLGILFRPETSRHQTLENIRQTGMFTLNSVNNNLSARAHQTSAAYGKEESEFDECHWEEERVEGVHAPFVKDALAKILLEPVETHKINANDCLFLVAKVLEFRIREDQLDSERLPNPEDWLNVSGLDLYMSNSKITKLEDARS